MPRALVICLGLFASGLHTTFASAQGVRTTLVTGEVVDRAGHSFTEARVYLFLPGNSPIDLTNAADEAVTDSLGHFSLRGPLTSGCYALVAIYMGYGRGVRTFAMAPTGRVEVGMVTLPSSGIPEVPTLFMRECERPGAGANHGHWGVDTVVVSGTVETPSLRR